MNSIFLNSYSVDNLGQQTSELQGNTPYVTPSAGLAVVKINVNNAQVALEISIFPNVYYLQANTANGYAGGNICIVPKGATLRLVSASDGSFAYFRPFKI